MYYSIRVHRNRDLELDNLWRESHNAGQCGGSEGSCYICCKRKLSNFIRGVLNKAKEEGR